MDINNQFDQELLSAYLDDGLTADELVQVERWLATDPTAAAYLDSLRSNRHTLKALASLPSIGLKSSLADRVLARTHAMDSSVGEKVRLPAAVETSRSRHWWTWGALAASAAAVAWFAILPFLQPTPHSVELTSGGELPEAHGQPAVPAPSNAELALGTPTSGKSLLEKTLPETPGGLSVDRSQRGPEERQGLDKFAVIQSLLVGDVMMTETAWNSGKFDQLLEKHGIRYEKELIAQPSLIAALIESQVTVGSDADPSNQQNAALVYIDSPGEALDKLLVEIENDRENFVGLNYNISMGGLGDTKADKLLAALRAQTGSSNAQGIARVILPEIDGKEHSKLMPGFEVSKKNAPQDLRDNAAKNVADGVNVKRTKRQVSTGGLNPEALIILRKN